MQSQFISFECTTEIQYCLVSLSQIFSSFFHKKSIFFIRLQFFESLGCSNTRPGLNKPRAAGFYVAYNLLFYMLGEEKWRCSFDTRMLPNVSVGARHVTLAPKHLTVHCENVCVPFEIVQTV